MYPKKQKEKNKNVQKAGVNFLINLQWRALIIGSFEDPTKYSNIQTLIKTDKGLSHPLLWENATPNVC